MQARIQGTTMPVLEVQLDPNDSVFSESGELSWMTQSIQMTTHTQMGGGGGLFGVFKRAVAGGTIFMTEYRAFQYPGQVAFATKVPGHIVPVQLAPGHGLHGPSPRLPVRHCPGHAHASGSSNRSAQASSAATASSCSAWAASGTAWLELSGELIQKELAPGEVLRVHPGHVGAFHASVSFQITTVPGIKNMIFGGDGLFLAQLMGPGTVWLQTLPISRLAHQISEYLPNRGGAVTTAIGQLRRHRRHCGFHPQRRPVTKLGVTGSDTGSRSLRGDILFGFAVAFALYLAWVLRHVLLLLYVSALFAVVLKPLTIFIADIRIGRFRPFRKIGIFVLLLFVFGGLTAFGFLAIPPAARDLHSFVQDLPSRLPEILEKLKHIPFAGHIDTSSVSARIETAITQAATYRLLVHQGLGGHARRCGHCADPHHLLQPGRRRGLSLGFVALARSPTVSASTTALRRAERRMERWLLGQGSLMLILGIASTITFSLLHVRYAYALGFLTGLLNIIPVVGAAVSIALALLVAAIDSWGRVLGIAIFYVVYLNVENSYLTPRIMQSSVESSRPRDSDCPPYRRRTGRRSRSARRRPHRGPGSGAH